MTSRHVQSARLFVGEPLMLDSGDKLQPVDVAYETYGSLDAAQDNAVVVCHALTGDAHVAMHDAVDAPGWWDGLIGAGKLFDTKRSYVVCANVLGSCYGTTGPNALVPGADDKYGARFPYPTMADLVRVQKALVDHLGIARVRLVIGGSLGGQQALQWAVQYPDTVGGVVAIACDERASPWVIALQDVGRHAILNALKYPDKPELLEQALATARMLAMVSYRTPQQFGSRFGRAEVDQARRDGENLRYEVESYLRYQGEKLVRRFEAHSYLRLTRVLDSFDIAAGHASLDAALTRIRCPVALVGIDSDMLFASAGPQRLAGRLRNLGKDAEFKLLTSIYGHDAFLIELDQLTQLLRPFVARVMT